jgi:hypothetical protein
MSRRLKQAMAYQHQSMLGESKTTPKAIGREIANRLKSDPVGFRDMV